MPNMSRRSLINNFWQILRHSLDLHPQVLPNSTFHRPSNSSLNFPPFIFPSPACHLLHHIFRSTRKANPMISNRQEMKIKSRKTKKPNRTQREQDPGADLPELGRRLLPGRDDAPRYPQRRDAADPQRLLGPLHVVEQLRGLPERPRVVPRPVLELARARGYPPDDVLEVDRDTGRCCLVVVAAAIELGRQVLGELAPSQAEVALFAGVAGHLEPQAVVEGRRAAGVLGDATEVVGPPEDLAEGARGQAA